MTISHNVLLGLVGAAQAMAAETYTPAVGSPERTGIMDAIRLTIKSNALFRVHLVIVRAGNRAMAVTDVSDASGKSEDGGIFLLQNLNSQWRALYTVGGGGWRWG